MRKNGYIKISLIVVSLFITASLAYVRFEAGSITNQTSNTSKDINLNELKSQATENADLEEIKSPAYFSVFKFINSFIPSK